jgi:5-formyltetrahydrofolate cyclo-ligase
MKANEKRELRKKIINIIENFSEEYVRESDAGITRNVLALPEFINASKIFLYFSIEREPDTHAIIEAALAAGKTVAVPGSLDRGEMKARVIRGAEELVPGRFSIPSPPEAAEALLPEELELIIVPALAFDSGGARLGKGGGYYDRFLSRTDAVKAGITRDRLLFEKLPAEPHDVAVDIIVTENAIARLKDEPRIGRV